MRVAHDIATDTLTVVLRDGDVARSDEARPGIVLDYDVGGQLVAIEILNYSSLTGDDQSPDGPPEFWREPTLDELAREQHAGEASFATLLGAGAHLWASDDEFEAFQSDLTDVRGERRSQTG